jgi:hypothetical protein
VDNRGYVQGIILGLNWDSQTRTMSWATAEIVDGSGYQYYWYTWDGWFDGYLNPGSYQATISEWNHNEGHEQTKFTLNVNQGERNDLLNFILDESQIPIPELSAIPLTALMIFVATAFTTRRRHR